MSLHPSRPTAPSGFCPRAAVFALPIGLGTAIAVSNDLAAGVAVGAALAVVFWRASR